MVAQHPVEQMLVAVLQSAQLEVLVDRRTGATELGINALGLLFDGLWGAGQQRLEPEGPALLEGEGRALVEKRIPIQREAAPAGLGDISGADAAEAFCRHMRNYAVIVGGGRGLALPVPLGAGGRGRCAEPLVTTDRPDVAAILCRLPLFQAVSSAQIEHVARSARERRLARGEMLFQKGDPCRGFYAVVLGQIKLTFPAGDGNEKVVEIIGPDQTFGEAVMFMDRPYPVAAAALADTQLLHIPSAGVFELLDGDPSFARRMLAGLSIRLHALLQDVEAYSLRSGAQRLIGYLLEQLAARESGCRAAEIELPASKQVIASRLNLAPETLSRVLHELSAAGLIQVRGRTIAVPDVSRLRRYPP